MAWAPEGRFQRSLARGNAHLQSMRGGKKGKKDTLGCANWQAPRLASSLRAPKAAADTSPLSLQSLKNSALPHGALICFSPSNSSPKEYSPEPHDI